MGGVAWPLFVFVTFSFSLVSEHYEPLTRSYPTSSVSTFPCSHLLIIRIVHVGDPSGTTAPSTPMSALSSDSSPESNTCDPVAPHLQHPSATYARPLGGAPSGAPKSLPHSARPVTPLATALELLDKKYMPVPFKTADKCPSYWVTSTPTKTASLAPSAATICSFIFMSRSSHSCTATPQP